MTSSIFKLSMNDDVLANTSASSGVKLGFPNAPVGTIFVNQTVSEDDPDGLSYIKSNVTSDESALVLNLDLQGEIQNFVLLISKDVRPTVANHELNKSSEAVVAAGSSVLSIVVESQELSGAGIYYVGIRPIGA